LALRVEEHSEGMMRKGGGAANSQQQRHAQSQGESKLFLMRGHATQYL